MRVNLKPVSVNAAWQGRRYKTPLYNDFEEAMLWELKSLRPPKVEGDYEIHFTFHLRNAVRSDLSNFIKTTEDIIVKSGMVTDDRLCWHMVVDKVKSDTNFIDFEIKPINRSKDDGKNS